LAEIVGLDVGDVYIDDKDPSNAKVQIERVDPPYYPDAGAALP
jgi:hypothetical protein